jgi:hypothetical protein
MHDIFLSSSFLFTFNLVCLIMPTLRTTQWGLWYFLYQLYWTQIYNTAIQSPHSQMLPNFYMPFYSTAQTPQFFIMPRHQPLISNLTLIWKTTLLSHWRSGILSTISLIVWKIKTIKIHTRNNIPLFFFTLLLILTSYRPFRKPSSM